MTHRISYAPTTNTRPHRVVPVGRQHADDQAPMVRCVVCDEVGEENALLALAPNSYGCAGYSADY